MPRRRPFQPSAPDPLEGRVVLSTSPAVLPAPAPVFQFVHVSHNQALGVIHRVQADFSRFAADYQRAYAQAVRSSRLVGEPAALAQLDAFITRRSQQLNRQLLADAILLPDGQRGLFPSLRNDVEFLRDTLLSTPTLSALGRFASSDLHRTANALRTDTQAYIGFVNSGGLGA